MDNVELAQQGLEHAHHAAEGHGGHEEHSDAGPRIVAVLISVLAAALAVAEMEKNSAQNDYLTQHIQRSDDYAFYQAKTLRSYLQATHAETLQSLPGADGPEIKKRIDSALAEKARLDDDEKTQGRKQLLATAKEDEVRRDEFGHHFHHFELVAGALQICIVLASVSVVTRIMTLAYVAGALGGAAIVYGLALGLGLA